MHGTNPIRPPVQGDGQSLEVVEIFPTVQGEGPHMGMPALFIRLGGCNLACNFCDTEFERFEPMALADIMHEVQRHPTLPLVVITGGEPFRQPIGPLCHALRSAGKHVQIETNGTLWRDDMPDGIDIVCSPKVSGGHYHPVRGDVMERVSALKFIVSAHHPDYRSVPQLGLEIQNIPVFLQPMDEGNAERNRANRAHALKLCMQHGYRLSLQLHKLLGVR